MWEDGKRKRSVTHTLRVSTLQSLNVALSQNPSHRIAAGCSSTIRKVRELYCVPLQPADELLLMYKNFPPLEHVDDDPQSDQTYESIVTKVPN